MSEQTTIISFLLDKSVKFSSEYHSSEKTAETSSDGLGRLLFSDSSLNLDLHAAASRESRRLEIPVSAFKLICLSGDLTVVALMTALLFKRLALFSTNFLADAATITLTALAGNLLFSLLKLYKIELIADFKRCVRRLAQRWFVPAAALGFVELALLPRMFPHGALLNSVTILVVAAWYIAVWMLIVGWRAATAQLFRICVAAKLVSRKVVVVGTTPAAADFIEHVHSARMGIKVVAVFDALQTTGKNKSVAGVDVRGGITELLNFHKYNDIDTVVLALPLRAAEQTSHLVRRLSLQPLRVRLLPGNTAIRLPEDWFAPAGELPAVQLLRVTDLPIEHSGLIIKFLSDKLAAGAALMLFAPLMLACAVIIKITSPGPVFFMQPRIGMRNRTFQMYKFRSMHVHDGANKSLTARNDRRIFPFGRIMRKLSFDELPQLINVLRGDMSMVGPRPHMPEATAAGVYYYDVVPDYAARHRVRPGITGWAQVNGWRGPTETFEQLEKRVLHDLYYIENWSFLLDMKILVRTALVGFFGKNAF